MARREIIGYLLWCAIGIILTLGGIQYGLGTPKHLGSGFIFCLSGVTIILLSGGLIIRMIFVARRHLSEIQSEYNESKVFSQKLLIPFVSMLVFCYILETVGFLISSFLLILSMLYLVGKKQALFSLITSILISIMSYIFFVKWLGVQLPLGTIFF